MPGALPTSLATMGIARAGACTSSAARVETYNNCPSLEYNNVGGGVWPIGVGHPCFG
jgi:Ni,Fe-hydrogenase I small subunit